MIHPDTRIGAGHLTITDLSRSLDFYQNNLGFNLISRENGRAQLGIDSKTLLYLYENQGARTFPRRTGLYHFAILVPSRFNLAQSISHLAETQTPIQGFADHNVSEAIYLADPDGNGIEIYRDRPRDSWEYNNGRLKMGTDPLDLESLLSVLASRSEEWAGLHPDTTVGHMHLHVSSIPEAEDFYINWLGFDLILRYGPSASFLSAGGYHHHLGVNTWNGVGIAPPPENAVGLRFYEIILPDQKELNKVTEHLQTSEFLPNKQERGWLVRDPAGNKILLTTPS